jgi:uncharacterized repeat protein (TIGR03837 family)
MHQGLKAPLVLIACRSVDFFGDAAVCLRLAQGLVARGAQVRILADPRALAHLQSMAPACAWEPPQGFVATSALAYWAMDDLCRPDHVLPLQRADVLLEAFQVEIPQAIFNQLPQATLRYLVDYLALEEWTTDCQWMAAPDPVYPKKPRYWLAPSLRQDGPGVIQGQRPAGGGTGFQANRQALRRSMIKRCEQALSADRRSSRDQHEEDEAVFLVFAYCYPNTPLPAFAQSLSRALGQLREGGEGAENQAQAGPSPSLVRAQRVLVFEPHHPTDPDAGLLSQHEFDQCMAVSDLALVRGEDSFGTALFYASQWGLPFVWQPYRQADDAHLKKLDAWLAQAAQPLPGWSQLHRYFSPASSHPESERDLTEILRALLTNWQAVQDACKSLGQAQFQRTSFEESLLTHWRSNRQQTR